MLQTQVPRQVTLDVLVTLREPDRSAASGVPMRIVLGAAANWQAPDAGIHRATADDGTCHLVASFALDDRRRKLPTNFLSSLLASSERTRHVQIAVEMEYAGRPWLTAIDIDRFENGSSARLEPMRVFGRAANGRFTDDVPLINGAWNARLPTGKVVAVPGFDVTTASIDPDTSVTPVGSQWTVRLTLTRWPAPTLRDQPGSR
jgi:hypothetical protein